jgi:hypothetical protein
VYSCKEVARCIASDEYLTAGLFKKLGIRLHLLMCHYCSRYRDQLRALAQLLRQTQTAVPPSEVEDIKTRIVARLSRKL